MQSGSLWLARLIAPLVLVMHLIGWAVWRGNGGIETPGVQLMASAWGLLVGFTILMWLRGDYIQSALMILPWSRPDDDAQLELARMALTRTCLAILTMCGFFLGVFWQAVMGEVPTSLDDAVATARAMLAGISFVGLAGSSLPTGFMAWSLPALDRDEADE